MSVLLPGCRELVSYRYVHDIKSLVYKNILADNCSYIEISIEFWERIQLQRIECIEFQCIEPWTEHDKKAEAFC